MKIRKLSIALLLLIAMPLWLTDISPSFNRRPSRHNTSASVWWLMVGSELSRPSNCSEALRSPSHHSSCGCGRQSFFLTLLSLPVTSCSIWNEASSARNWDCFCSSKTHSQRKLRSGCASPSKILKNFYRTPGFHHLICLRTAFGCRYETPVAAVCCDCSAWSPNSSHPDIARKTRRC